MVKNQQLVHPIISTAVFLDRLWWSNSRVSPADVTGPRPIDLHLKAFEAMGAKTTYEGDKNLK